MLSGDRLLGVTAGALTACSGPFLEATAATSRLSHHLVRALEVCGEVGGFLRLVKDVMVTVLLKGESLKVRFGGE